MTCWIRALLKMTYQSAAQTCNETSDIFLYNGISQAVELAMDESSFTGETEPVQKSIEIQHEKSTERTNVAFMGTLVRCGRGKVRKKWEISVK